MTTDWADEEWTEEQDDLTEAHMDWLDRWAPRCPMRNPQRPCRCLAYRELEPGTLQLRVPIWVRIEGVCAAIVEEDEDNVYVRVIMCYEKLERDEDDAEDDEYVNYPVHVDLERPVNGRAVIDVGTDRVLPLFVPGWDEASPQPERP